MELARVYFNFSDTPFTGNGTKNILTLGNGSATNMATALRPRAREHGIVHVNGKVMGYIDGNGEIYVVNYSDVAIQELHGTIMYRYSDSSNLIRDKYLNDELV